jgi:hypothetical protein
MNSKRILLVGFAFAVLIIAGCFFPLEVDQPASAVVGETITTTLNVRIDETEGGAGGGPSGGICAILLDTNWTIEGVEYDGDYGVEEMNFLHPDSSDHRPTAGVDFWNDSLEYYFPPTAGKAWYVYETPENYSWIGDTSSHSVTVKINVETTGENTIGYFVSTNDLKMSDSLNYSIEMDNPINVTVNAIEDVISSRVPEEFGLDQNYPNPFNPSTKIRFQLEKSGDVRLSVYDLTGREIAVLINGHRNAGEYQVEFNGENLSSGVYLYRLVSEDQSYVRKMMLIK